MASVYLPVFIMVGVALLVAAGMCLATSLLGPKNMTADKAIPYESGSATVGGRHVRLSVKFYLTAILFVVFDVEAVFLYPWAALFRRLGWWGLTEMLAFVLILGVTLLYVWKKGALEWER